MASPRARAFAVTLVASAAMAWAGLAQACVGAGVIVRIDGHPQDVIITRTESGASSVVSRPRVLDVVCQKDTVHAVGATFVVLSIDGSGTVRIDHNADYTVPARSGAPTILGNAYRSLSDQVMPDMKRLPWNVRLKGVGDDFGFALPTLSDGGQQVRTGDRTLLVRLVGGAAPYVVEIRDASGALVTRQTSDSHEVVLPRMALVAGPYRISASDATPGSLDAVFTAVNAAPPADESFSGLADPEIRAAAMATTLARNAPAQWSFEAEQQLEAAPADGLDRDKVYELIESYGDD